MDTATASLTQAGSDADDRELDVAIEGDLLLLRRVADGDQVAFHDFFEIYYHRLLRFSTRMLNDRQLVEEVVNDTLLVVWRKAESFDARSRVSTWIFGIAYRLAMKALAARKRRTRVVAELECAIDDDAVPSVAAQLEDTETRELLKAAIMRLSPEHRDVIRLTYYKGYSCAEIAVIVECPVNTVKSRLFKARGRLRAMWPTLMHEAVPAFQEIVEQAHIRPRRGGTIPAFPNCCCTS